MIKVLSGFFAGLSVGVYCLSFCLPLFLPLVLAEKRTLRKTLFLLGEFSLGRLLGYLFFGLLFGYLGKAINSSFLHRLVLLVNFWLGALMVFYSLGQLKKSFCPVFFLKKVKWLFLLGFLTGVNLCPPFLASLTYVFSLREVIFSLFYFFSFFLGTTFYFLPFVFLGPVTKFKMISRLAQFSGIGVGGYFIYQALLRIW